MTQWLFDMESAVTVASGNSWVTPLCAFCEHILQQE